jgi:hypothetical protein
MYWGWFPFTSAVIDGAILELFISPVNKTKKGFAAKPTRAERRWGLAMPWATD